MWLRIGNVSTIVTKATAQERDWLYGYLSFEEPARGRVRGTIRNRMFNGISNTFPSGFLSAIRKGAAREGFTVEVEDTRTYIAAETSSTWAPAWLDIAREQPQMLAACLRHTRGIVQAPTGSGKTETIAALTHVIRGHWLILVHTKTLMDQTAERITERTGEATGCVGDGRWEPARVTVATFQTIARSLKSAHVQRLLQNADGVIADECHSLAADNFLPVFGQTTNAFWRFGFSATPLERGDRRNVLIVGATGEPIYSAKEQDLVDAGKLMAPKVRMVPCWQNVRANDWHEAYALCVRDSITRNRLIASIIAKAAKPALCFVAHTEHAKVLGPTVARLTGLRVRLVSGADTSHSRADAIKRLRFGELDCVIATPIFDEGLDVPELASVILAGGGKSMIKTIQRIGRVKRIAEGKTTCEVWDIADQGNPWLEDHAQQRRKMYLDGKHEVIELSPGETAMMAAPRSGLV